MNQLLMFASPLRQKIALGKKIPNLFLLDCSSFTDDALNLRGKKIIITNTLTVYEFRYNRLIKSQFGYICIYVPEDSVFINYYSQTFLLLTNTTDFSA